MSSLAVKAKRETQALKRYHIFEKIKKFHWLDEVDIWGKFLALTSERNFSRKPPSVGGIKLKMIIKHYSVRAGSYGCGKTNWSYIQSPRWWFGSWRIGFMSNFTLKHLFNDVLLLINLLKWRAFWSVLWWPPTHLQVGMQLVCRNPQIVKQLLPLVISGRGKGSSLGDLCSAYL